MIFFDWRLDKHKKANTWTFKFNNFSEFQNVTSDRHYDENKKINM